MRRPFDYTDGHDEAPELDDMRAGDHEASSSGPTDPRRVKRPRLSIVGWLRWFWRQLTSMRTAIVLLLLLALGAIPGSLVPQRHADPNGVTQYFTEHPDLAPILDKLQLFDVYTSIWFSAIYLLLFTSLVGCVVPRVKHHLKAMRARPPKTPVRLSRLSEYSEATYGADDGVETDAASAIERAQALLKKSGYRVERYDVPASRGKPAAFSVSAERGYLRETGNLVFHSALLAILVIVGVVGSFGYSAQRVVVEGQSFVNTLSDYDSFDPGRFFDESNLVPFSVKLDQFDVTYEQKNLNAYGQATDYTAHVTTRDADGEQADGKVKVNHPLRVGGSDLFLLGNGYAPTITVKDPDGNVVFTDSVPFLPQDDSTLSSVGVVKVPDGLKKQIGMAGFFYPTAYPMKDGTYTSTYPGLTYPLLTLNVYSGDLGIDDGDPKSVYSLNVDGMKQLTGGKSGAKAIELMPGQSADLPNGLGTVEFVDQSPDSGSDDYSGSVKRYVSFNVGHDPTAMGVGISVLFLLAGLLTSLFVPRRRLWVKARDNGDGTVHVEYAGLARGEDPRLEDAVTSIAYRHGTDLGVERP